MTHVAPWFESGPARRPGQPEVISPLVAKCRHIGDDLLRAADPEIHARLAQLQVEPQLFLCGGSGCSSAVSSTSTTC